MDSCWKNQLEEIAARQMARRQGHDAREPGFIFTHGKRVAASAIRLGERMGLPFDGETLYAAGLFHDVGKGLTPHDRMGAVLAQELLEGLLPAARLERVLRLIERHDRRPAGGDVELGLLQDADLIDHKGIVELWMNFAFSFSQGQGLDRSLHFYTEEAAYTHNNETWRGQLNFPLSVEIFDRRVAFEHMAIKEMKAHLTLDF